MVKLTEKSALVPALPILIVRKNGQFLWKTVDYITYTNSLRQTIVQSASVGQAKSEAKSLTKWKAT